MNGSPNKYLTEPRLFTLNSILVDMQSLPHGGFSVACRETIFRPPGGGQPVDYGTIEIEGATHRVADVSKANGKTYFTVPGMNAEPKNGVEVIQRIDGERRDTLSRLHTLQHMLSAEICRKITDSMPVETGICEDATGAWITLHVPSAIDPSDFSRLDQAVRSNVLAESPVNVLRLKSVEHAEWQFSPLFRANPSVQLSGKVRVIEIYGVDANCCSGTHWTSSNVGPYSMTYSEKKANTQTVITIQLELLNAWSYWYRDMVKHDQPVITNNI